jgi:hypothetical protein
MADEFGNEQDGEIRIAHRPGSFSIHTSWPDNEGRSGTIYHAHATPNEDTAEEVETNAEEILYDNRSWLAIDRGRSMLEISLPVIILETDINHVYAKGNVFNAVINYREVGEEGVPRKMVVAVTFRQDSEFVESIAMLNQTAACAILRHINANEIVKNLRIDGEAGDDVKSIVMQDWYNEVGMTTYIADGIVNYDNGTEGNVRIYIVFDKKTSDLVETYLIDQETNDRIRIKL